MDDPIRSQLPNENYRKGWDETFGKKEESKVPEFYHCCTHGSFGADGCASCNSEATPGWDHETWCARCQCSHFPPEAHVDHG